MFENYQYFLTLAEENNVSRAAERLFVTHQCLSRYLSKLEKECGVTLFNRKPVFSLTKEGQLMLETLRQAQFLEKDIKNKYNEMIHGENGEINFGTTEGRFRIFMPDLISAYQTLFPNVELHVVSANSIELREMLLSNKLDLILVGSARNPQRFIREIGAMDEKIELVISEEMLAKYFPDTYPYCIKEFAQGADLRKFQHIPFAFNQPEYNSSKIVERHLEKLGIQLNCVHVSSHPDLHHQMTTRNYAASFCLTMYLPNLDKISRESKNKLYNFPIKGLKETNPVGIEFLKNREFPQYATRLIELVKSQCKYYSQYTR